MRPRTAVLAIGLWLFSTLAAPSRAASPRQLKWEELVEVVNKDVSVAMPSGAVITGRAVGVQPDALLVRVKATTDAANYPKGLTRVSRPALHVLEIHTKGHLWRAILTPVGVVTGMFLGAVAALSVEGGLFSDNNPRGASAAFFGITAGGGVLGYFGGNAADRHSETVRIVP
jgi:hypothetical protein